MLHQNHTVKYFESHKGFLIGIHNRITLLSAQVCKAVCRAPGRA